MMTKMTIDETIRHELNEALLVLNTFISKEKNLQQIDKAARVMVDSINTGGKIISCGNGGSHADAMHFAEEMTGQFRDRRRPLPAVSISDPTHMTCVANDYGFKEIFSRYIEALGKKEDVLLAISTSGNSENMINAAIAAKEKGMKVVALTGKDGGKLAALAQVEIRVPHFGHADRIQEIHIKVIHIIIQLIEKLVS
ncbi:MAG: D-sedoheptulose 7-phosphate isomerase [Cyclobacteriaceae bacterium]